MVLEKLISIFSSSTYLHVQFCGCTILWIRDCNIQNTKTFSFVVGLKMMSWFGVYTEIILFISGLYIIFGWYIKIYLIANRKKRMATWRIFYAFFPVFLIPKHPVKDEPMGWEYWTLGWEICNSGVRNLWLWREVQQMVRTMPCKAMTKHLS